MEKVCDAESKFLDFVKNHYSSVLEKIRESRDFPEDVQEEVTKAIEEFTKQYGVI